MVETVVKDLEGVRWKVEKTDPAEGAVKRLKSLGFGLIVLDLALLTGVGLPSYVDVLSEHGRLQDKLRHNDCLLALGIVREGNKVTSDESGDSEPTTVYTLQDYREGIMAADVAPD